MDDQQAAVTTPAREGLRGDSLNLPRLWQGGPANAYGYLGEIFFVLVLYIFVNLANLVYHWRFRRPQFNWFLNGFIPVAGIVIDGYILYTRSPSRFKRPRSASRPSTTFSPRGRSNDRSA